MVVVHSIVVPLLPSLLVFTDELIHLGPIATDVSCPNPIGPRQRSVLFNIERIQRRVGGAQHGLAHEVEAVMNVDIRLTVDDRPTHHVETVHLVEHGHAELPRLNGKLVLSVIGIIKRFGSAHR